MKKYKTFEAISMLNDNPDLKFTMKANDTTFTMFLDEDNFISVDSDTYVTGFDGNVRIDDNWTIMQKAVSFIEAVEAYSKEHNIYCKIGNEEHYYTYECTHLEDDTFCLSDDYGNTITTNEILRGTWYIEN